MTEEIINALSKIPHLKVTARTSSFVFKSQKKDVRTIGAELGVSLVLEGSVRKSGDHIRITAQLIRTDNGFHIWSEKFDRKLDNIFELQDEISLLIADKIREHFGHLTIQDHLVQVSTNNIEAYERYLKGRHFYNKWDMSNFLKAAECYQESIEMDPSFDLPYFGAGLSFSFLGSWGAMERKAAFQQAEMFFERGRQLGIPSAYKYYSIAKHQFWGHWNYKEAYTTLLKAYDIQPEDSGINEFMAEIHTLLGNFSTALRHIEKSILVDPLSPPHFYTKANIYYLQGSFEEALNTVNEGLTLNPDFTILTELKMACQIHLGIHAEPAEQLIGRLAQQEPPPLFAWDLYQLTHSGNIEEAEKRMEEKVSLKMGQLINMKHDPFLQPLRNSPAYQRLILEHFPDSNLVPREIKPPQEKQLLTNEEANSFKQVLLSKMNTEKYYLASSLTLKDLAVKIELHPNKLSWLLNNKLGKNFYDFVNGYRLKEFQKRALDPKNKNLSVLGLAHDSGFNSKSVFNDYFKKATGMTPKAWINKH